MPAQNIQINAPIIAAKKPMVTKKANSPNTSRFACRRFLSSIHLASKFGLVFLKRVAEIILLKGGAAK